MSRVPSILLTPEALRSRLRARFPGHSVCVSCDAWAHETGRDEERWAFALFDLDGKGLTRMETASLVELLEQVDALAYLPQPARKAA